MTENDITPVQEIGGIYFKRDDLYRPFGAGEVNGGKLRQCMMLVKEAMESEPGLKGVITYCSIHSPQAPITAAVARDLGIDCIVMYGGTSRQNVFREQMPRLVMSYGGKVEIPAKTGRHNVLKAKAQKLAKDNGYFLVQYGINLDGHGSVLLGAVAEQVQNIPDDLDNLYVTCGSGITASGIMIGLERYGKRVENVHLCATAYSRTDSIHKTLKMYGADREFIYHDMFHQPGFQYEKKQKMRVGGVLLHPQYEAKTMKYLKEKRLIKGRSLFWVVGAEPGER